MAEKFKDFDQFFKEKEKEPIKFKLFGKQEILPSSLPAIILLKLNRAWKEYKNEALPDHVTFDFAFEIFGEKRVEKWCEKGLTSAQLEELIKWALSQYGVKSGDEEVEVEDDAGKK